MPQGRFGLDRPMAESLVGIRYSVLTPLENARFINEEMVKLVAEQSVNEVIRESESTAENIVGADLSFDSRTDNLFITVVFSDPILNVAEIIEFVRDHFDTLASRLSSIKREKFKSSDKVPIDKSKPDDLPPNSNTFHLVEQSDLGRNVEIIGK